MATQTDTVSHFTSIKDMLISHDTSNETTVASTSEKTTQIATKELASTQEATTSISTETTTQDLSTKTKTTSTEERTTTPKATSILKLSSLAILTSTSVVTSRISSSTIVSSSTINAIRHSFPPSPSQPTSRPILGQSMSETVQSDTTDYATNPSISTTTTETNLYISNLSLIEQAIQNQTFNFDANLVMPFGIKLTLKLNLNITSELVKLRDMLTTFVSL
jgi:hypothetical protein